MKELLQSKIFKRNIRKWLFMYIVCMGVFTTVVTYSKYISNMLNGNDEARVSKFNIELQYCKDESCNENSNNIKKNRPTNKMEYYFAVDTNKLEVNANLFLTVSVDNHFKIEKIEKIVDGNYTTIDSSSKSDDSKTRTIEEKSLIGSNKKLKYKVTIIYDETVIDYNSSGEVENGVVKDPKTGLKKYIFNENTKHNILTVGYSAIQIK